MLKGNDAGNAGLYGTVNNVEGLEASVGLQASFMFSDISLSKFNLQTLKAIVKYQGGYSIGGGSLFKSYDGEYKGNWIKGKTFQKKSLLYHGYSLGVGPEDISVYGSRFSGETKFIGDITNRIKSNDAANK